MKNLKLAGKRIAQSRASRNRQELAKLSTKAISLYLSHLGDVHPVIIYELRGHTYVHDTCGAGRNISRVGLNYGATRQSFEECVGFNEDEIILTQERTYIINRTPQGFRVKVDVDSSPSV